MSYKIDFAGKSDRDALLALVNWFGWKPSLAIFRAFKNAKPDDISGLVFAVEMGGVSGHPVRRLIARFHGENGLRQWIKS